MKKKIIVVLTVIMMAMTLMPATASATAKPYKDVSVKSVGQEGFDAVCFGKIHWFLIDIAQGKKFHPYKKITRRQFCLMLGNAVGDEYVPVNMTEDIRFGNTVATEVYICNKMVGTAKNIDPEYFENFEWNPGSDHKVTRVLAAMYLMVFTTYDEKLAPRQGPKPNYDSAAKGMSLNLGL